MKSGKLACSTLLAAVGSLAQPPAPHIVSVRGGVSVFRAAGEKMKAGRNLPLAAGDRIAAGRLSRAEVLLEPAVRLRVDGAAEIRVAELETRRYRMELARGAVTCHVDKRPAVEIHIDTPSVSAHLSRPGVYRISVNRAGESEILAREGEMEVFSPAGSQPLLAGQKMIARGAASNPQYRIVSGVSVWRRALVAFGSAVQAAGDVSSSSSSSSDSDSSSGSGSGGGSAPAKEQASQPVSKPAPVSRTEESVSRSSPRTGSVR